MKTEEKMALWVRLGAIAILLAVVTVVLCANARTRYEVVAWHGYTVVSGDTLYGIAQRITPDGVDYRRTVDVIKKENGVGAMIYPGQMIMVPEWEEAVK